MKEQVTAPRRWFPHTSALRVTLIYASFATVWITASDWVFSLLILDEEARFWGGVVKGVLFVVATSLLLYAALARLQAQNRRAASLLAASEDAYRTMFANNPNPMWVYETATLRFLAVNAAATHRYGWSRDEFLAMTLRDIRPPEEVARFEALLAQQNDALHEHTEAVSHHTRSGERLLVSVSSHAITFRGRAARLVLALDVTEQARAEQALRDSQVQLHEAQRIAGMGSWWRDLDSGETHWSPEVFRILGVDPVTTTPGYDALREVLHPADKMFVMAAHRDVERTDGLELEHRLLRPDGSVRDTIERMEVVATGGRRRLVGIIRDVTERNQAERALAESERKYRQLVELMPDGLLIHDGDHIIFANPAMAALAGVRGPADLQGRPLSELLTNERTTLVAGGGRDLLDFHPRLLRHADGALVEVEVALQPVALGAQRCEQVVIRDMRVHNRMQAALAQANERLSRLSSQVLHTAEQERRQIARELHDDVGQLLTFARMTGPWLQRRLPDEESRQRAASLTAVIGEALDKVRNLASALRPRQLDEAGLEAAMQAHLQRYLPGMAIAWELECDTLSPRPDASIEIALFRVFQEALTNVIKHSGATHLRITLRDEGRQLRLRMRDDGGGFEGEAALAAGAGGLGLMTMQERAHLVGGTLAINSSAAGTEVVAAVPYTVTPLLDPAAQTRAHPSQQSPNQEKQSG